MFAFAAIGHNARKTRDISLVGVPHEIYHLSRMYDFNKSFVIA